jgi:hypothetical protein
MSLQTPASDDVHCSLQGGREVMFLVSFEGEIGLTAPIDIATAQAELRASYVRGGPGAVVSGIVWLLAAITASVSSVQRGFGVLFFAGMLIFPISALLVRAVFRRNPPSRTNPGGITVMETVVPMIAGLLAAWLIMPHRIEFVFPLCAIAVGTHYFGFQTAYGDKTYWTLGAVMCFAGVAAILSRVPDVAVFPYAIAAIELLFGFWLTGKGLAQPAGSDTSPDGARHVG